MKAIKIASGVAVSALALAISAQANAAAHEGGNTEFSMSATGSMEVMYMMDLVADTNDVDLDEGDDFDSGKAGEAWGLQLDTKVVHGPFSGTVRIVANDDNTANENGSDAEAGVSVQVKDLIVTDGPISFGQVGSLLTTDDYAYDMGDSTSVPTGFDPDNDGDDNDLELDDGAAIGAGLRYTMNGLQVQIEGQNDANGIDGDATTTDPDYGVSAAYAGESGAIAYVVDAQFRGSDVAPDGADAYTYMGAGVTYTSDIVTAKAGFNTYTAPADATQVGTGEKESFSEYGFELSSTPVDALTVYLKGQDLDAGNDTDSMLLLVGSTYTVDVLTFKGEYKNTAADGGDQALFNVSYKQDKLGAYGEVTLGNLDGDNAYDPLLEAGVSYTQDNGVKYAADWDMQGDVNADAAEVHTLKLSAAYAF
ncbi:MAG: hypothetical protein WD071_00165 [Pseudohongiella sp.]|uniref:hypothetical protein n=1 Tax=Pseudohongiella sp. TaxID=1979412 RepID=UPI0034A01491